MLARGAHLNAVGAILPGNAEFFQNVFERAGFIAVDDLANARKGSRELIERFDEKNGEGDWSGIHVLADIIARNIKPPAGCDVSLFKSMGMGVSDLSVAIPAYERARRKNFGRPLMLSQGSVSLRWRAEGG